MYAEERRLHILEMLKQKKRVDVSDLADRLNTSPETIRRDLREMEAESSLKRTHGGAIYVGDEKPRNETPVLHRKNVNYAAKCRIAQIAATLIDDGDVIVIDNSTTGFCMLQFIPLDFKITLLTNSIPLVNESLTMTGNEWTCICLGGVVNKTSFSTVGSMTETACGQFRPNKLFMSCAGIDADGSLTEGNLPDTEIKREFMARCRQKYLLADAAKLGQPSTVVEGDITAFDCLITDAGPENETVRSIHDKGVKILFANTL